MCAYVYKLMLVCGEGMCGVCIYVHVCSSPRLCGGYVWRMHICALHVYLAHMSKEGSKAPETVIQSLATAWVLETELGSFWKRNTYV